MQSNVHSSPLDWKTSVVGDILPANLEAPHAPPILEAECIEPSILAAVQTDLKKKSWLGLPFRVLHRLFQLASLILLLAIASSIPLLQFASLGYMLEVAKRIATRRRNKAHPSCPMNDASWLPGLPQAGRLGVIAAGTFFTWLPVWLISDYAYSAELIEAGGRSSRILHVAATIATLSWLVHVAWALLRGGRWYHFLWPAPWKFLKTIWRPNTWRAAEDGVWQYTVGLQLGSLFWLGIRGALGAIAWLMIPGSMMIAGMQSQQQPALVLIGLIGALGMSWVLMYLPFLQVHMARENRLMAIFDVASVRTDFKRAPWAFWLSFLVTLTLAIPLYLFRIESLPQEILWLPCLFFVIMTLPARMLVGWAMGRGNRDIPRRHGISRWTAWLLQLLTLPTYILFLYLATLASWDGALVVFLQHAFLVPVPFSGN